MALCWCSTMTMMSGAYKQPQKGKGMGVGMGMGKGKGKGKGKAQTKQRQSRGSDGIGFGGKRNDPTWQCIQGCGACCKLDKGPSFATPEEIFDDPSDVKLYRSMVGPDGWCIHYEKSTRTCSIYSDRPYFCRVEPNVFQTLYGIGKKRFNKEACSFCEDTIKAIYGSHSQELDNFVHAVRSTDSS
ncbi:hypothetical protein VitviT2T_012185 [Vitis vinifera]|uniref:Zinc/iron-chelating domain-containing protein n=2 Tax=Vitis vinifera TaxID=29760 RepID=A0ABY9CDA0_VITVI|eukprot:XP_002274142.1 PREDICTED: uncharacterized protein LOC100243090 [Vitis vinifera]